MYMYTRICMSMYTCMYIYMIVCICIYVRLSGRVFFDIYIAFLNLRVKKNIYLSTHLYNYPAISFLSLYHITYFPLTTPSHSDPFLSICIIFIWTHFIHKIGDEEPNSHNNPYQEQNGTWGCIYKGGIIPGFGMYREVAAYILDGGFAGL